MSCLSCYIMFSDPKVIRRLSEGYPKVIRSYPKIVPFWLRFGGKLRWPSEILYQPVKKRRETRRDDETTRRRDETRFDSFVRLCWALLGFVAHGSKPQFQLNFNSIGKKLINS